MLRTVLFLLALVAAPIAALAEGGAGARTFLFNYEATVTGLQPGEQARVWLPVPPSGAEQQATVVEVRAPVEGRRTEEPEYGNGILYFEAAADGDGEVSIGVTYRVHRRELGTEAGGVAEAPRQEARFLEPDALVPTGGAPAALLADRTLPGEPMPRARVLYDVVLDHMTYSKEGEGWGRGDAVWACDSRFGNCTDFHSLFISLARSQGLPAAFEIGFPLPPERGSGAVGGYHCWAKVRVDDGRWLPVDISEADKNPALTEYYFGHLTEDRVTFSVGRDIDLVPQQAADPLNFFVYPHVEVNGRPHPEAHVTRAFSYEDLPIDSHAQQHPREAP